MNPMKRLLKLVEEQKQIEARLRLINKYLKLAKGK